MNVIVRDTGLLRSVPSKNVASYLRAKGWSLADKRSDGSTVWTHDGRTGWILLPESPEYGDYAVRLSEILAALQDLEVRSQLEILFDIHTIFDDIVRLRYLAESTRLGSIPFPSGVQFLNQAKELLLAAASAAVSPARYFSFQSPQAREYLRKLHWQSTHGSFVLTILSPVFVSGALFGPDLVVEPYARKVTRTLAQAVAAISETAQLAEKQLDVGQFEQIIPLGVSANLCDALAGMSEGGASTVDLSLTWAGGRDLPVPEVPARVHIHGKYAATLRRVSEEFRRTEGPVTDWVAGIVTDLHSEMMLPRQGSQEVGQIVVAGVVDGKVRRIRTDLVKEDYLTAVDAHRGGQQVRVYGTLRREGNYYYLEDAQGFAVETDGNSDW